MTLLPLRRFLPVPIALQATLPDELARVCNIELVDARRIVSIVHRTGGLPERAPATIRRVALDAARAVGHVPTIDVEARSASLQDPFVKYAFRLSDGAVIETVRIPLEQPGRYSVCVSSQVGCALACAFCATGRMGLGRNLETWEIIEQVRRVRTDLRDEPPSSLVEAGIRPRTHGVLFQGMGEPLANVERVIAAIRVMSDPSAMAIDMRNITVCTSGLPTGIRLLMREVPGVRLGLSMGSARPSRRRSLMPIDDAHPLAEVLVAAGEHARATRHSPMFAYTLLANENDSDEDAIALADLCRSFAETNGVRPRLSLIPYNSIASAGEVDPFSPSTRLDAFRAALLSRGVGAIVRYSGGGDVGAACGQLARPLVKERRKRHAVDPDTVAR
ncbi:MAG: radical SAM protein [Polyangiaceae bacterium]|nr:radical SAM protein [Polyangiaceae bacterium]